METRFSALVCLAFCGSIGLMFLFLACALPSYGVWWPFFVVFFYLLAPLPLAIAKRNAADGAGGSINGAIDVAVFIVACIVVSAFGLPLILARVGTIAWGAAGLVVSGNVVIFLTMLAYFLVFSNEDVDYSMW